MEDNFIFPELDEVGESTLDSISSADKFNQWMFDTILPFSKGQIFKLRLKLRLNFEVEVEF
jgi:hypothetical protein